MNSTRSNLVKISAIIAILSGALSVPLGIMGLLDMGYYGQTLTGLGYFNAKEVYIINYISNIVAIVLGACSFIGAIILLKTRNYQSDSAHKFYKFGCGLVIFGGLGLGLQSIFLYAAFASQKNDYGYAPKTSKSMAQNNYDNSFESRLRWLRDMRDRGEINEEEYSERMFDIINNK